MGDDISPTPQQLAERWRLVGELTPAAPCVRAVRVDGRSLLIVQARAGAVSVLPGSCARCGSEWEPVAAWPPGDGLLRCRGCGSCEDAAAVQSMALPAMLVDGEIYVLLPSM